MMFLYDTNNLSEAVFAACLRHEDSLNAEMVCYKIK